MNCKRCKGENVRIEQLAITSTKGKTWKYWLFGGWLISIFKYMIFGVLALIPKLFKRTKIKTKIKKMATCQSCGFSWNV